MKKFQHMIKNDILDLQDGMSLRWCIKTLIRLLLIIFGVWLITKYIPPFLYLYILDAGNLFGLGSAGIIILAAVFTNPLLRLITKICQSKKGKAVFSLFCTFVILFYSMFLVTLVGVVNYAKDTAVSETTVIVLGCKVNGTVASTALRNRTITAINYMEEHPDAVAILTGGQGWDEGISEAEAMQAVMEEYGIDESRYYIEDKATSTDENMAFSKQIIDENNLSSDVAIATHDYHQRRAAMIAEKNGLHPSALPLHSVEWSRATFFSREVFGIWIQYLKGIVG